MRRGVAVAGGVLLMGGVVLGGLPMPLGNFGCESAFETQAPLGQLIELEAACGEIRADRQNVAVVLIALGLASAVGAAVGDRRS